MIEQAEGVERVADDLCHGPGCDKQQHTVLTLHLQKHTRAMIVKKDREKDVLASCCGSYSVVGESRLFNGRTMLFVSDAQRSDHTAGRWSLSTDIRLKPMLIWC